MTAIGVALLSTPVSIYYADKNLIETSKDKLAELQRIYDQQEKLLDNVDDPYIIERAAIGSLKYIPLEAVGRELEPLPDVWPDLEKALASIETDKSKPSPGPIERWARKFENQTLAKSLLLILGSGLVVLSLAFFYRQDLPVPHENATG